LSESAAAGSLLLLDRQVEALLAYIARYRDERCRELRAKEQAQARDLLRAARSEARHSVHRAIGEARTQLTEGRRRIQAHVALEGRMRVQRETRALLEEMWGVIGPALESRWSDPILRKRWIEAAFRQASRTLSAQLWRIEHGRSFALETRAQLTSLMRETTPRQLEWIADDAIVAGMRIRSEGVCLDATVAGLLASRQSIESAFLAQYLALQSGGAQP